VLTEANRLTRGRSSSQRQLEHLTTEITRWQKNLTNKNQGYLASSEPGTPNTQEKKDSYLKSYLMMLVEDFKKDINKSLKEIQNTAKQVKVLKEETEKSIKELQGARQWWRMPLIPTLGRQRQADF
jgi:chromosome segregation ATPase